jgi:hypothetical protein
MIQMTPRKTQSRAPMMLTMAAILALPMALTAGIGIYRAERAPAKAPVAERPAPVTPPADAADADQAGGER